MSKFFYFFAITLSCLLNANTAFCSPPPPVVVVAAVYNPSNPGDNTTLKGGAGNGQPSVFASCYYPASYNTTCQGGGIFDSVANSSCTFDNDFDPGNSGNSGTRYILHQLFRGA
jgi:hypothetical protein